MTQKKAYRTSDGDDISDSDSVVADDEDDDDDESDDDLGELQGCQIGNKINLT